MPSTRPASCTAAASIACDDGMRAGHQRPVAEQVDQAGNAAGERRHRVDGAAVEVHVAGVARRPTAGARHRPRRRRRPSGRSVARTETRESSWRRLSCASTSSSAGWPIRTTWSRRVVFVSTVEITRICSSTSGGQVLRFVDDEHAPPADRMQRQQEVVERAREVVARGRDGPSAADVVARDHAEVEQDLAQQLVHRQEGVEHQRRERRLVEPRQQRPGDRGLAGADVAGEHDHAFVPARRVEQLADGLLVRFAQIEEMRVGRQRERRLREAVVLLVGLGWRAGRPDGEGFAHGWNIARRTRGRRL